MIVNGVRTCLRCRGHFALARVWFLDDPARSAKAPTWMPVDVRDRDIENDEGNLAVHRLVTGELRARVLRKDQEPTATEVRAMPHFATCGRANVVPIGRWKAGRERRLGRA